MENIIIEDLQALSEERIADAKALFDAGRYAGAVYICGYTIELGLKKKMCMTLGWDKYEGDAKYKFLKTHDFEILLHFSGVEKFIKKSFIAEWSVVMKWNPESRYSSAKQTREDAKILIESTEVILRNL